MTGVESGPDGLPAREPESVPEHETVGGPVPVLRATGLDVLVADTAAAHLLAVPLPVGVATAVLGAPYLIHLVLRSQRRAT